MTCGIGKKRIHVFTQYSIVVGTQYRPILVFRNRSLSSKRNKKHQAIQIVILIQTKCTVRLEKNGKNHVFYKKKNSIVSASDDSNHRTFQSNFSCLKPIKMCLMNKTDQRKGKYSKMHLIRTFDATETSCEQTTTSSSSWMNGVIRSNDAQ